MTRSAPTGIDLIDFDAAYRVKGWSGVAWEAIEHPIEHVEETWVDLRPDEDNGYFVGCDYEWLGGGTCSCPRRLDQIVCVMVGDDRHFTHDVDDLEPLTEGDWCPSCGQIGCGHGS